MPLLSQAWLSHEFLAHLTSHIALTPDEACAYLERRAGVEPGDPRFRERVQDVFRTLLDDGLIEERAGQWRIVRLRDGGDLPEELPPISAAHYADYVSVNVRTNKYERDRKARQQCIAHYGARCQVCDFDFESVYGALGDGCVRVHHVVSPGQLGPAYKLDPVRDLRPVCANCHYMLHRTEPAVSVEHLRQLLQRQQLRARGEPLPPPQAAAHRP